MTSGPVWDGEGTDPWLPQRLRALAWLIEQERHVFDDWYARLSAWLVKVARAVLRTLRPDASALWAFVPDWRRDMDDFARSTIGPIMGHSYRVLLGDGYRFDSRPFVHTYLAQVANRMVNTPDQVFDLIAGEISEGSGLGESIPELADRVDTVLSATSTPRWKNRATVVARTETIGANNAGRFDAFQALAEELDADDDEDEDGSDFEQMWLATDDDRTRRTHSRGWVDDGGQFIAGADGQRVPLGQPFTVGGFELRFPGDPSGPAHEVIQCRCTTLLLRVGEEIDLSNRQFRSD